MMVIYIYRQFIIKIIIIAENKQNSGKQIQRDRQVCKHSEIYIQPLA